MEAYAEAPDDPSDYNGGIIMTGSYAAGSDIDEKLNALIRSMRNSEDYRRYQRLEAELSTHPDLKRSVDNYRRRVFEMQNSSRDIFDETDYAIHDFDQLAKDPLAADYLDAENTVCGMIRKVVDAISEEVIVRLPDDAN